MTIIDDIIAHVDSNWNELVTTKPAFFNGHKEIAEGTNYIFFYNTTNVFDDYDYTSSKRDERYIIVAKTASFDTKTKTDNMVNELIRIMNIGISGYSYNRALGYTQADTSEAWISNVRIEVLDFDASKDDPLFPSPPSPPTDTDITIDTDFTIIDSNSDIVFKIIDNTGVPSDGDVLIWSVAEGALVYSANDPYVHVHDGQTLENDGINSDGGAFNFDTSGVLNLRPENTSTYLEFRYETDGNGFAAIKSIGSQGLIQIQSDNAVFVGIALWDTVSDGAFIAYSKGDDKFYFVGDNEIILAPHGDLSDYIELSTPANIPTITFVGAEGYIINLADPTNAQDAVTKNYVDTHTPIAHTHDGDILQLDGINSDGGAFSFSTSGQVTFNQYLQTTHIGVDRAPTAGHNIIIAETYTGTGTKVGIGCFPIYNPSSSDANAIISIQGNIWFDGTNWGVPSSVRGLDFFPAPQSSGIGSATLDITGITTGGMLNVLARTVTANTIQGIAVAPLAGIFGNDDTTANIVRGIIVSSAVTTTGTWGVLTGIEIQGQSSGVINQGLWLNGDGIGADMVFGLGKDADMYWNGTNLVIDPDLGSEGSGIVLIGTTGDDDMKLNDIEIDGDLNHDGSNIGFYGTAPIVKPTVTGAKAGNAALASLLTQLVNFGLIIDNTT